MTDTVLQWVGVCLLTLKINRLCLDQFALIEKKYPLQDLQFL